MLARVLSGTIVGLDGIRVDVEVDVAGRGFPTFNLVGLPDKAIEEAKDRVRTAIANSDFEMPDSRITVNLAPAGIPKVGAGFDMPIAIGILAASGMIKKESLADSLFIGELSLEGKVRPVPGIIPLAILAEKCGLRHIYVPADNAAEARLIHGITIYAVARLADLILHLNDSKRLEPVLPRLVAQEHTTSYDFDFAEIRGQEQAKRALEIASAGFHNIHLKGVPGAGKTMLSRAFPSILPPMTIQEIIEVSQIYSVMGLLKNNYIATRPFRAPHHTTSRIGLIGGGSHPAPGEISLSHRGVLFLDELPEFPRTVLESLRQPMEDGIVTVSRASGSLTFPARFLLLAASNPCPCGYLGHPTKPCTCMPGSILKYAKRLSGPLLDRIDLHVDVPPVIPTELTSGSPGESSEVIRSRVTLARSIQTARYAASPRKTNGELTPRDIEKSCVLQPEALNLLKEALARLSLSARSYFKIIKVAQTIADLSGKEAILPVHIAEALQYRSKID